MTDEATDLNGTPHGNPAGDRDGAEGASGADRLTAPADDARTPRLPFAVVGIGASAGGLEAYTEFLRACPADSGMAFVLVQHLPPDRESLLVDILARYTAMPVAEVADGQPVEPNRVYVIRPGHTLTVGDGRLHLGPELAARGHGRPVDDFFRSLAEEQQQRAVAVVFSGMGSNGTAGAEAVKGVGGLVIAQEPESAKFPAMPRSLIDAHLPDYILRPAEVPEALVRYAGHPYAADPPPADGRDEQALADVLAVLRTRTRHDFSGYRKPTIRRRVQRRMSLGQFATTAEYVRALRQTPAEVTALADDLLIHVTGFFRDPRAWEVLRAKVIDPLAADRPDGAEVRCWVAACATGEEAYTLAMLLTEAAEAAGKRFDVKVFATDMAERALGSARAGVFPNGIESEVTPERLSRFFDRDDSFYRVKKELRERVIFAPQNVLHDPPFSRLDIATCRNLLIYLEPDTQRRVLGALHFGLREGGALMLGSSESAAPAEGDFEPIDKKHRLFRRVGPTRPGALDLHAVAAAVREARPLLPPAPRPVPTAVEVVNRTLLDWYTPAAVAVDAGGQVVHVHGDTARYLSLPTGGPTHDLLALANDQVRGAVRAALHKAADTQHPVTVRDGVIDTPDGRRRVEVGAAPLAPRGSAPLYLVTFRDFPEPAPPTPTAGEPTTNGRAADELERVRHELQSALEEMQSSNEELKAAHEEATSLNEELQSTNEELETSREEMQSLNEELVTVNAQLQAKMGELEATANDLGSLLTSTDIAVLFLDPRFRIRRFTAAVKDLLDLIPSDVGRPLSDLRRKFTDPHLLADAEAVLDRLVPVEREVESESGRAYLRRVLPYRTQDNRIDGVVVAFVDITHQRAVEAARRESEEKYRGLFEAIDDGFCLIEVLFDAGGAAVDYRFLEVNPAFEGQTGIANPAGRRMRDIAPAHEAYWFEVYGRVAATGEPQRFQHAAAALGRHYDVYAFRLGPPEQRRVAVVFRDITARNRAEVLVRESEGMLRAVAENLPSAAVFVVGPDLRYTLAAGEAVAAAGLTSAGLEGKTVGEVMPQELVTGYTAHYQQALAGEPFQVEHQSHGRHFVTHGTPLRDAGGRVTAALAVSYDITERVAAERALADTRDRLEERVGERTAELEAAVEALEAEMGRRREMSRRLATAQEGERRRVSRDLHDTLGQLQAGLGLAVAAARRTPGLPAAAAERLGEVGRLSDELARETHALAVRLRPTSLDDLGLVPALRQLAADWFDRTGVGVEFDAAGLDDSRLPAEVETAVYRVVQEALTNAAKHAAAGRVSVAVTRAGGAVTATIEDDGGGFDPDAAAGGRLGLVGMRERVELAGGSLQIESSPGAGTTVIARFPLAGDTP